MRYLTIYTLLLDDNNYYVGLTSNLNMRLLEHFEGIFPSKWTKLHKPIKLMEVFVGDSKLENIITLKYMVKYGYKKVRGSSYTRIEINKLPLKLKDYIE